jgi:hypothetical protein
VSDLARQLRKLKDSMTSFVSAAAEAKEAKLNGSLQMSDGGIKASSPSFSSRRAKTPEQRAKTPESSR